MVKRAKLLPASGGKLPRFEQGIYQPWVWEEGDEGMEWYGRKEKGGKSGREEDKKKRKGGCEPTINTR